MRIVIVNGSHRKNGATALILNEMYRHLIIFRVGIQPFVRKMVLNMMV